MVPEQPGGEAAIGLPGLREPAQRRGVWPDFEALEIGGGRLQCEIAGGEHVLALEREQQIDLGGPGPEAAHGGDRRDGRLVVEPCQGFGGEAAVVERRGQGTRGDHLWARESGAAERIVAEGEERGGLERARQGGEPAPDRGGGLV